MLPEDQKRILGYFIEEAKDHLNTIEQGLVNLQATIDDPEMINEVFRAAHSVKGGAAMLGLQSIQRTSHRMEDFFKLLKESPVRPDVDLESMLLQIFDGLQEQLERLQSPFGLTEDQGQAIIATLEPVFEQAEVHLQRLIETAPVTLPEVVEHPAGIVTSVLAAPAYPETSALQLVFRSDVPELLRNLLDIFKQADTPTSRHRLTQICQRLHRLGEQFELAQWCALAQTVEQAVGNAQQTYRTLATIVIRDLKQAQELVLAGRAHHIEASVGLRALLPVPSPVRATDRSLKMPRTEALDDRSVPAFEDRWVTADALAADRAMPSESEDWFDQLTASGAGESSDTGLEAAGGDSVSATEDSYPTNLGPQVGADELNSLADLFEGEQVSLDDVWEDDDLAEESPSAFPREMLDDDIDREFADLFESESDTGREVNLVQQDDDDLVSLFGSALDGDFTSEFEANQESPYGSDLEMADDSVPAVDPLFGAPHQSLDDYSAASAELEDELFTTTTDDPEAASAPLAEPSELDEFFGLPSLSAQPPAATVDEFFTEAAPPIPGPRGTTNGGTGFQPGPAESAGSDILSAFDLDVAATEPATAPLFPEPVPSALFLEEDDGPDTLPELNLEGEGDLPATEAITTADCLNQEGSPSTLESAENADTSAGHLPHTTGPLNQDDLTDQSEPSLGIISDQAAIAQPLPTVQRPQPPAEAFEPPTDWQTFLDEEPLVEATTSPDLSALIPPSLSTPEVLFSTNGDDSEDDDSDNDGFDDLEKLLEGADQLGGSAPMISTRRGGASTLPRSTRRSNAGADQTMRVSVGHLDNLSNLVGELVVNRNSLEQDQERLRQSLDNLLHQVQQLSDVGQRMRDLYERSLLESSLMANRQAFALGHSSSVGGSHVTGATFDALEMDRFTGFHTLSQEMIELIVRVREASSDIEFTVTSTDQIARQFRQVTTQLQEGLNKARMVPFSQTADRLPRAVRDISLRFGKEAKLVVEGRDTLIDKMILERLYDPMTHLVNNAITHGIESPAERLAQGKPREGTITIRAFYQGNQTVIYIADNGSGINPVVVKAKAIEKGLITAVEAQSMSDQDVYDLLFLPGFTTRDQADAFSGRGVGMDVVRTALNDIRGSVTIESEVSRGTSFTIRLPLTLSITKALSCVNNQARIAFPMDGVEDMFDVPKERIQTDNQGHTYILWRDTLLPFRPLGELLEFNRSLGRGRVYGGAQDEDTISIVVLRSASTFIGLQVDQVIGEQEIVIKQLEGPVPKPTGIAGATVLGDGRVMPIADVLELIDLATGRLRREAPSSLWSQPEAEEPVEVATQSEPTVLIVDDSITVRELLSLSFNKVGYRVEQARDGQEAWEKLRSGLPCDLVFCDIEMPRMDGLELLSRMQKDDTLSHIPIAMLTSRGADRHRQMALELGAKGYIIKPYLEEMLLDAAQRMLKGESMIVAQ